MRCDVDVLWMKKLELEGLSTAINPKPGPAAGSGGGMMYDNSRQLYSLQRIIPASPMDIL